MNTAAASDGEQMFANRLKKNLRHLGRWLKREVIHCYRLYDADIPEYALAVDVYEGDQRWVHVQEYEAPKRIDPAKAKARLDEALRAGRIQRGQTILFDAFGAGLTAGAVLLRW